MSPERWEQLREICATALERDPQHRGTFIVDACREDAELRAEVESLISAHTGSDFLECPAIDALSGVGMGLVQETARLGPLPGERIGRYQLMQPLGEGGMGTVYLAEQTYPVRRQVALKLIKVGMDTREVLHRFETERQALARMNHPHVATVYDGGATKQGRPYFVMEYVPGTPITDYCNAHRVATRQRLRIFTQVCQAIQHAHQKGIIHRDIKPSNVLVVGHNGDAIPKVIDFGMAKAIHQLPAEQSLFTEQGRFIGTPAYMSPEQAQMSPDIDTRTDIYSLGVLLYELLAGAPPFDSRALREAGYPRLQQIIREVEPPTPSTRFSTFAVRAVEEGTDVSGQLIAEQRGTDPAALARLLRGDLDWITMKALEKDRSRRYATAADLAADIARYLREEPVLAGPPILTYRLGKFVRRHRYGVIAAALLALAIVAGALGTSWQAFRATKQRDRAIVAEAQARDHLLEAEASRQESELVTRFLSDMLIAVDPGHRGKDITVREVLDEAAGDVAVKFRDAPLVEARLRDTIGIAYASLGLYDDAEPHLVEAARIGRRVLGEQHRDTLTWTNDLANLLGRQGNFEEAERTSRTTWEVRRRLLGEEHPETLQSMQNLASHLYTRGQWREAEELHRKTLDCMRRLRGAEHRDTLRAMYSLAADLSAQGHSKAAGEMFRECLETQRRVLGDEDPETLKSMTGVATELRNEGDFAKAAKLLQSIIEIQSRVLSPQHPETAKSMNNLAICFFELGRVEDSERVNDKALDIKRKRLGPQHPETLSSLDNVAGFLAYRGELSNAEELARQILTRRREAQGDHHPQVFDAMDRLASVLLRQGRTAEAVELYGESLAGRRRVLGDGHPETLGSLANLAKALSEQQEFSEAKTLFDQALALRRGRGDDRHPATAAILHDYGQMLVAMGRPADAEPLLREALDIHTVCFADHWRTTQTAAALDACLKAMPATP